MGTTELQNKNKTKVETVEKKKAGIKDLFQYKSYMAVFIATLISRFGDALDSLAYSYMVYKLTGSKLMLGTLLAVNFIPNIIFTPFSGVIADNYSKKKMIIISDIARGLMVAITATLYAFNLLRPWHLFAITFLISTFESFAAPAKSSLMPLLIPKEMYLTANSFSQSAISFASLLGVASVAFFIATVGISGTIAIDAITFFTSALLICFVKYNEVNKGKKLDLKLNDYIMNIKEGLKFLYGEKILLITIFLFALINFSIMPFNVLRVPYVEEILNMGPEGLSYTSMSFLIGTIIGGLLVAQFGSKFKKRTLVIGGVFVLGACYSAFSLPGFVNLSGVNPIVFLFALGLPFGISIPFLSSPLSTMFMEKTPKELLGRVNSVTNMLVLCASPLGASLSGIVANYIPITTFFLIMGSTIVLAAFVLMSNKDFKNV